MTTIHLVLLCINYRITRRTSCKSIKSEVSAWTEDEETLSKAESTYVSQENVSMKG